ncbi:hypothetical protein H310_01107 [Aphanomyces invadans]|uniref:F-box domain-containing protein n=1 Tax=Aphanomyces invadans TaxID=157072 RepID=A0A024USC5_9STRA|nr:hypothetical protein H310_01107 [Aphanomyces invadans]ETW08548.1 hypothetical protein H310_01107 [Aphanomyces invadans]|eukprot:XP_008862353.1 hypothetical protein H310_01107 [Aphanomyces invadans]
MFFWCNPAHSPEAEEMVCVTAKHGSVSFRCDDLVMLPIEIVAKIVDCLNHMDIHHLEAAHPRFRIQMEGYNCWKQDVVRSIVLDKTQWFRSVSATMKNFSNHRQAMSVWKRLACLTNLANSSKYCQENLIADVLKFSSADRESEGPGNTLRPSKCWGEIQRFGDELVHPYNLQELSTFSMFRLLSRRQSSLGETIQMLCGCSSGNSCYWSSAASSSPNAEESIFYRMRGHCIVRAVSVLPYRVFWHPHAPTYGPKQVSFSFFANERNIDSEHEVPFYVSPVFDVVNDMVVQTFELPLRVILQDGYMSVNMIGRHQAQTFDVPTWMQAHGDDNTPKYYCCLSQVRAHGVMMDLDAATP